MPRKAREGRTPDAVRNRAGAGGSSDITADVAAGIDRVEQRMAASYAQEVSELFKWFCLQDDGWLRVVPAPETLEVHLKWKFTAGDHNGCYCYVRVYISQLDAGLHYLREKVSGSRKGTFSPTPDRPFGS